MRLLAAVVGAALAAAAVFGALRLFAPDDIPEKAGELVRNLPGLVPPGEGAAATLPGPRPVKAADGGLSDPTGTFTIRLPPAGPDGTNAP